MTRPIYIGHKMQLGVGLADCNLKFYHGRKHTCFKALLTVQHEYLLWRYGLRHLYRREDTDQYCNVPTWKTRNKAA